MRGSVNVNDLFDRYSSEDLEAITTVINENVEATKQSRMPLL
jgi:hypothetical protein